MSTFRYAAEAETSEITQSVNTLNSCLQNCLLVHRQPEKHDSSWKHWNPLLQRHFGLNTKCKINNRPRLDDIRVEARLWRLWLLLSTTCFMTSDLIRVRSPYWLSKEVLRSKRKKKDQFGGVMAVYTYLLGLIPPFKNSPGLCLEHKRNHMGAWGRGAASHAKRVSQRRRSESSRGSAASERREGQEINDLVDAGVKRRRWEKLDLSQSHSSLVHLPHPLPLPFPVPPLVLTLSSPFVLLPEHTIRTTWDVRKHGV